MSNLHFYHVRKYIVAGLLAIASSATSAQETAPAAPPLKVSAAVGPAYSLGLAASDWAKRIGEQSQGRFTAKLFPGAMLAQRDPSREFAALRDGAADLAVGSTLYWSVDVPPLRIASLPWLAPESAQVDALVRSPIAAEWLSALEKAGVVPLAFAPLAHRALASRERVIAAPGDLAGLKVRVPNAPVLTALYGGFGAQPLTMAFGDSQSALAAGTLDLQDGTLASFAGAQLGAVGVQHVLLWNAVVEIAVFAANRSRWDVLSEADRAILKSTAEEMARELAARAQQENDSALIALRKSGIRVTRLSAAERALFVARARETYDKLAAALDSSLVRAAEAAVKTRQ